MSRWLPVPDYEGLYEVSDNGQVRRNGRILKMLTSKTGHLSVTLSKAGCRKRQVNVHRLVLIAFVGQPPSGTEARHYPDRSPSNNRLDNLSWATRAVNVRDRIGHETDNTGERHGMSKLTWENVRAIREGFYTSQKEAAQALGVDQATISLVMTGKRWRE
jgi:DNA-binding XRE family transcriptional regulator